MKYVVDRIEENIAICQSMSDKSITEIEIKYLPHDLRDGDIIVYENNIYSKDDATKKERINLIKMKMERLKNINK